MMSIFKGCEMDERKFLQSWNINLWKEQSRFHLTHPEVNTRRIEASVHVESRLMIPLKS
jgi:hypothetical protein